MTTMMILNMIMIILTPIMMAMMMMMIKDGDAAGIDDGNADAIIF